MAIFQPTNIIPSSFTQGTVDVNDNMEISWQVNGNSAMTAFQIDFYLNDTNSTYVTSTGKLTDNCPFYGTDRFGNPQFFTYNARVTWADKGLTNGNNYKFKITQWYKGENSVIRCQTGVALSVGNTYYFTYNGMAVMFSLPSNLTAGTNDIYYSRTNGEVWVDTRSQIVVCGGSYVVESEVPTSAVEVTGTINETALDELFISQTTSNAFSAQVTPTLTIYRSNGQYSDKIDFPNNGEIATSIGYFKADYTPETSNPIRWIRWQVATANNGVIGDILADTGDIYTPTLNFEFNGFFNGQQYAIRVTGESESGQATVLQGADKSGWIFFTINIENQGQYDGNFTVRCLHKENAALLKWEGIEFISPTVTPQGYVPTISNGAVTLNGKNGNEEYSVSWDNIGNTPMSFPSPWATAWKGEVKTTLTGVQSFEAVQKISDTGSGYLLEYTPNGKYLFWCDVFDRYLVIYNVTADGIALRGYLISDGTIVTTPTRFSGGYLNSFAFNGAKNYVAVGTNNRIFLYSFVDGNISLIYAQPIDDSSGSGALAFSPDGDFLVAGAPTTGLEIRIFSTRNNALTYLSDFKDGNGSSIIGIAAAVDFNYDGTLICFCLAYGGNAYLYSFNEGTATFIQELPINNQTGTLFYNLKFSKNKNTDMLIVGVETAYYQLKVNNSGTQIVGTLSDIGNIYQNASRSIAFSPNGDYLLIGGSGYVNWYRIEEEDIIYQGKINTSAWNNAIGISWNPIINQIVIHNDGTDGKTNNFHQIIKTVSGVAYFPQGKLFELRHGTESQGNLLTLTATNNVFTLNNGSTVLADFTYPTEATSIAVIVTPNTAYAYFYGKNGLIFQSSTPITYTQQPITSISVYGGDSGTTVDCVSVYQGDGSNILSLYNNPNFEPIWNNSNYNLYMTANFNGNLEGGTGTANGASFRVYRQEVGKNTLTPIATVPSTTTSLKDYGISSRKAYKYSLYAYDSNGAFMSAVEAKNVIATCFKNYSLLVCDYDGANDEYHVRKQYLFALNLSAGSVGNNNKPTLNANFTPFPTRMGDTANYASGTLQGLIGAIYTVPALIEQIGNYKWTAKPSTMDYFDSVDLEKELYDLSVTPYQLFLRDKKGHLRMIATSGAISMTTNIRQKQQSISISLPWVEIGDASDVTIIQTPDDYGWNNDNQVLDVQLDVDVETGELSTTYPFPYNGTKFYLTGVNKENLTAKTPIEVTPAQFNLSDVAEEPDDGEVTATVTVNAENN